MSLRSFTNCSCLAGLAAMLCYGLARNVRMMGAVVAFSVLATMRTSAIDAMVTKQGGAVGIPRGELAGASATWMAVIRMLAPQIFRVVAERARSSGTNPGSPFFLAAACCAAAQLLLRCVPVSEK